MRWTLLSPLLSLGVLLAAPASAAVGDFRLPPPSRQPQADPDRQGPVVPDVPESRQAAPTPTPTARATAPSPAPTSAAPRIVVPDLSRTSPAPTRTSRVPGETPTPSPAAAPTVATDAPLPGADATGGLDQLPAANAPIATAPLSTPTDNPEPEAQGSSSWPWVLGVLAALAALGFAAWTWWQRRPVVRPGVVPQVERPRVTPAAAPAAPPAANDVPVEPLQVTLEPLRLSLTLINATLAYRLEIANRGLAPIAGLAIGADMISAHASMTREQQLSGPGAGAATLQRIERLDPGESRIVEGEFRLPFPQIVPIRQGNAALLLPLARFRLEAEGAAPVVRTFAVGQPGAKQSLQPFRLDLGPRVYPTLTQRAFA
jgi:hypothetical protein